jgi:hypothetical protein
MTLRIETAPLSSDEPVLSSDNPILGKLPPVMRQPLARLTEVQELVRPSLEQTLLVVTGLIVIGVLVVWMAREAPVSDSAVVSESPAQPEQSADAAAAGDAAAFLSSLEAVGTTLGSDAQPPAAPTTTAPSESGGQPPKADTRDEPRRVAKREEPPSRGARPVPPTPPASRASKPVARVPLFAPSPSPSVSSPKPTPASPAPSTPTPTAAAASVAVEPPPTAADTTELRPERVAPEGPAPPPTPTPTAAATPAPAAAPPIAAVVPARSGVQGALFEYRDAVGSLDTAAVRAIWPSADVKGLARAFDGVQQQRLELNDCRIAPKGSTAQATCAGTLRYVPRIGNRSEQVQRLQYEFRLKEQNGVWLIDRVITR